MAVLAEVEGYLGAAAEAVDSIVQESRTWVYLLPTLHAQLTEHCRPAVDERNGVNIELLVQAFLNAAVESVMTNRGDASDPRLKLEDYYELLERLPRQPQGEAAPPAESSASMSADQPQEPATGESGEPAAASASAGWPAVLPIMPGVYARLMAACQRSACPEIGLTPEKLATVMVNTGISGFFGGSPAEMDRMTLARNYRSTRTWSRSTANPTKASRPPMRAASRLCRSLRRLDGRSVPRRGLANKPAADE